MADLCSDRSFCSIDLIIHQNVRKAGDRPKCLVRISDIHDQKVRKLEMHLIRLIIYTWPRIGILYNNSNVFCMEKCKYYYP